MLFLTLGKNVIFNSGPRSSHYHQENEITYLCSLTVCMKLRSSLRTASTQHSTYTVCGHTVGLTCIHGDIHCYV